MGGTYRTKTQEEEEIRMATNEQLVQAAAGTSEETPDPYLQARALFVGEEMTNTGLAASGGADALATSLLREQGYRTNRQGQILYDNGVVVDPQLGTRGIIYPSVRSGIDPATVPGSTQWFAKIQREWTPAQIKKWRTTLADQGYKVAETGGMAYDLIDALRLYHTRRYLNFGTPQPLFPKGGAPHLRKSIDFEALREEIKGWGQVPFEEDLDPDTADYFADRTLQVARRLIKEKGWTPEQAMAGAEVRVQEEFVDQPGVKRALREAEDDEMDQSLRDSIVSISQLASM